MRLFPPELVYGLSDGVIIGMVLFFATAGWVMGKFHEFVLWRQSDAIAKARIVQGIVASYVAAIFAFWFTTPYAHYPLLLGCGAATMCAYVGVRVIELVASIGMERLQTAVRAFFGLKT